MDMVVALSPVGVCALSIGPDFPVHDSMGDMVGFVSINEEVPDTVEVCHRRCPDVQGVAVGVLRHHRGSGDLLADIGSEERDVAELRFGCAPGCISVGVAVGIDDLVRGLGLSDPEDRLVITIEDLEDIAYLAPFESVLEPLEDFAACASWPFDIVAGKPELPSPR